MRLGLRWIAVLLGAALAAGPSIPALAAVPPAPGGGEATFTDIAGNFAQDDINMLRQAGVIPVPADGLFRPSDPVTRLDFAVWAARALELPVPSNPPSFQDEAQIPSADQGEVAAAAAAGLVNGYPDGTFRPELPITRAELATVLGRALMAKGEQPQARFAMLFADGGQIPSWALPSLLLAQDQLIYGEPCSPEPCFAPQSDTTRAEAATILVRFLQYESTRYHQAPLPPPAAAAPPFVFSMWYSNSAEGYANLLTEGTNLNELIYGGYSIQAGGQVAGYDSPRTLAWAKANPQVSLWVMVEAASLSFLSHPSQAQNVIAQLVAVVQRAGYAGVNFDVEGIPAAEGGAYTSFITQAAAALHAIGAKISVDVPAETKTDLGGWWDAAYNYPALGATVDQFIIMAYDFHWPGGTPGPISPLSWDQATISYAASVMPARQVILGLPAYGYLWRTSNDTAGAYWESGMENMASQHGATLLRDQVSDEVTYTYNGSSGQRVGWFLDGQSVADRLAMAHAAGIGGVVAWRLDYDTPDWWSAWAADLAAWR